MSFHAWDEFYEENKIPELNQVEYIGTKGRLFELNSESDVNTERPEIHPPMAQSFQRFPLAQVERSVESLEDSSHEIS